MTEKNTPAWTFLDILLITLGLALCVLVVMPLIGSIVDPLIDQETDPALEDVISLTEFTAFYVVGFFGIVIYAILRGRTMQDFGLRRPTGQWVMSGIGLGLLFIPVRLCLVIALALLTGTALTETNPDPAPEAEFSAWYLIGLIEIFLLIVFLAPLVEEIIFRGILHSWLHKVFGAGVAVFFSGFLFGIAHLSPLLVESNILLGFVLSWAYQQSGSLWVSMLIHFVNNAVVGLLLACAILMIIMLG